MRIMTENYLDLTTKEAYGEDHRSEVTKELALKYEKQGIVKIEHEE
jgi:hypothetical protein